MGLHIQGDQINKYTLISYLNSKMVTFFGRLLTKKRAWEAGNIARIPIPIEFLNHNEDRLLLLSKESYELRREWDTGYPMSPIFTKTFLEKVVSTETEKMHDINWSSIHPYRSEFSLSQSPTAIKIRSIKLHPKKTKINDMLREVENQFNIMTNRLSEIDVEINSIINSILDKKTQEELDYYYKNHVGKFKFFPEPDIWLRDFIMAIILEIIKNSTTGIFLLEKYLKYAESLYGALLRYFYKIFDKDSLTIQPLIKEFESLLGKELKNWIAYDFFFYHCKRFGGRPIVWQFTSKISSNLAAMDIFIDYHQLNKNTLSIIRIDYVQPFLKILEQNQEIGLIGENEVYKIKEVEKFLKSFQLAEIGYDVFPSPNLLMGKNDAPGKGHDKTYQWVFSEASKTIQHGYNPDPFMGVLVNIIPLCLDIPNKSKNKVQTDYKFLCPKGTIKHVLKKIQILDQLKQKPVNKEH